jgi:nitrogen fixation/metabolism regulation signal transduction histidine kinase
MGLVIFGSIIVVILITFFVLSYMIRKRITDPVDQLAAAAEQVNEGNLDVEITVHEGGEFEGLERAFKQMVESWQKYIDKSLGEE